MKRSVAKRIFPGLAVFTVLIFSLAVPVFVSAQPLTHTVQKGDTLWGICEKYYGDPALWPKLWQMNAFVTNPHWLKPGDIITLMDMESFLKTAIPPEGAAIAGKAEAMGIDVSTLTNIKALGYLSPGRFGTIRASGQIFSSDKDRIILAEGDKVALKIEDGQVVVPGDELKVFEPGSLLTHPVTEKPLGYVPTVSGRVVVRGYLRDQYFRGEVVETYREVRVGHLLMPAEPISGCVMPLPADSRTIGNIVAAKDRKRLIGQYEVVYLDLGFNQGVQRGNLFDVLDLQQIRKHQSLWDDLMAISKYDTGEKVFKNIPEMETLQEITVGKILILESRPETSSAIVITAQKGLSNGSFVRGVSWTQAPEFLLALPPCPLE